MPTDLCIHRVGTLTKIRKFDRARQLSCGVLTLVSGRSVVHWRDTTSTSQSAGGRYSLRSPASWHAKAQRH